MEPILDECSLVPNGDQTPAIRIGTLAATLKSLHALGAVRVLRSVRAAAEMDIGEGQGLRYWCHHKQVDRDAGRFVASLLNKQPFVDGSDGLFCRAQQNCAVEARRDGVEAIGLAVVALSGGVGIALPGRGPGGLWPLEMTFLDETDTLRSTVANVPCVVHPADIEALTSELLERVIAGIGSGADLLERAPDMFPRLRFGSRATKDIGAMSGAEETFKQLFWHLRVLDQCAREWTDGPFEPRGIPVSPESPATLNHGRYGPMRDFPMPDGFEPQRWSWHTKITGGENPRLYFQFEPRAEEPVVLIGYFGSHLRTVRH